MVPTFQSGGPANTATRNPVVWEEEGWQTYRLLKFFVFFRTVFHVSDRRQYFERSGCSCAHDCAGRGPIIEFQGA